MSVIFSTIFNLRHKQLSNLMPLMHGNIIIPLCINPVDLAAPLSGVVDWKPWLLLYKPPVARGCHTGLHLHFSRLFYSSRFSWRLVLSLTPNDREFRTGGRLGKEGKVLIRYTYVGLLNLYRTCPTKTTLLGAISHRLMYQRYIITKLIGKSRRPLELSEKNF